MARNSRTHSNLGARSPSGNTRGGCRGCIPFRLGQSIAKEIPRQFYGMMYLHFCPPRISPKENGWSKRRIPPQTPPPPLAKSENSRGFAETFVPRKLLPQNRVLFVSPHRDSVRKKFGLCLEDTTKNKNSPSSEFLFFYNLFVYFIAIYL